MTSTEEDLRALKADWDRSGLTWHQFGDFLQEHVNALGMQWFPDDAVRRGQLQSVWKNHPNHAVPATGTLGGTAEKIVVVFRLHPHWAGTVRPNSRAYTFLREPTYQEILGAISVLFSLSEVFPHYELRGVYKHGDEFTLIPEALVVTDSMTINIVPRFATVKFHIATWSVEYNRYECRKLMKANQVSGSVTRDNVDSILVTMNHEDMEVLEKVYRIIATAASVDSRGYCHDPQWTFGWGSLESVVRTHKGTAKRDDGVKSWDDDEAMSGSTYFNTPLNDDDIDLS